VFEVNGGAFADAIGPAAKVAAGARFGAVTLSFRDQRMTVAATDFETTLAIKVPVKGKKATAVAVHADRLVRFAKAFASGDVTIDVTPEAVTFTVHDTVFTLPPIGEPPAVPTAALDTPADLDVERFLATVGLTAPCASTDDARVVLTGVWFDNGTAVATDSYRLAVSKAAPAGLSGLFPAKALRIATAVFAGETDVVFEVTDASLLLRSEMRSMALRRIVGEYPNWRNLMQTATPVATFEVSRAKLMASLDKVVLAADEGVACRMHFTEGEAQLSARTTDGPTSFDPLPITMTGDAPDVGVNGRLFRSMLSGVTSEMLSIAILDPFKPLIIVDAVTLEAGDFKLLQMPVKLAA
jgi:DNA polymerase III sliding clamp (beta) subunit (PCNA family)